MKVLDILQLKPFEKSTLLTGKHGLSNKVESVMIIEALDIEKWAVKNQILLTSYVAFMDKDKDTINDFFRKISSIGISAIILKTKRFIDTVPEFFIDLCKKHKIPLIEIPATISYESIILSIHEPLLNYDSFLLRSYYDASKTFSHFVNPKHSYVELAECFTKFTNLPISLKIPERNFEFISENLEEFSNYKFSEISINNHFAQHRYFIRTIYKESNNENELYYLHIKNIIDSKRYHFYIQINSNSIDHSLILIIEKFLEVLSQKLDSEYYHKNEIFIHRNKTISAILFGINRDQYDLELLLEEVGLFKHKFYQVLLLTFPKSLDKMQIKEIKAAISNTNSTHVYYESKNTLVYIFNFKKSENCIDKFQLKKYIPNFNKVNYYLSKQGSCEDIQKLFSTCLKMKQFNDHFYISNLMDENDMGIFNFLINISPENYESMIPHDLKTLFIEKYELFETLYRFITNHLNYGATAADLYLHPKTIRYRINKIENILQLDLNNPIQLTNYTIGCILLNLRKGIK